MLSGVYPSPPDARDYPLDKIVKAVRLPDSVRLDDQITILNQGFCGTCVGKSGNGIMSAKFQRKLSSLFIYALCKQHDGIPDLEGTFPRTALQVMKNYGSCLDETLPYVLQSCTIMPHITREMKEEGSKRTIITYARAYTLADIQQALAAGHLIMAVIQVGDNFMYYRGGVLGPMSGKTYGYHAVILCGYNFGSVRGANSWGEGWGEKGFFWLSNEVFNSPTFIEAWVVEIGEKPAKPCAETIKRIVQRWKSRK